MKKTFILLVALVLVLSFAVGCAGDSVDTPDDQDTTQAVDPGPADETDDPAQTDVDPGSDDDPADTVAEPVTIRIGASPTPHSIILEYISDELAEQGVLLDIVEFTDFATVNPALYDGQIDANYFQHRPFLDNWIADSGNELTRIVEVHIEPMSIYSAELTDLDQVPEGGLVAIPNDAVNGGRALSVLAASGLITLPEGIGIRGIVSDIVDNPLNLTFLELEAPLVPAALDEVDIAVINTNFALGVGLNPTHDALFMENPDSPFANMLVTRPENANDEAILLIAAALTTERVREFILERFEGAVVPAF